MVEDSVRGVLALGILEADGIREGPLPAEFAAERDRITGRLVSSYGGKLPADIPGVAETRALFHQLGVDPTKTRPSSEALLRRVLQGKGLPEVNPTVDLCNLCSLEHQLPLGLYDHDALHGTVVVRVGKEGEGYTGLRRQRVNLDGRLLLADDSGPFGAPTADSGRTSVGPRTQRLLVVVFCHIDRAGKDLGTMLERLAALLTTWCSARITAVQVVQ